MSQVDKQALRSIAENATPGEWCTDECHGVIADAGLNANYYIASCSGPEHRVNARYIAAANPATMLAMLDELDAAGKRIAELEDEKEYISKRFKEADLIVGRNLIAMRAAIIEWRATGDAKSGMAWIFNTLIGHGELPSENEKNAQAYFDREDDQIDKEMMELHKWFWERSKRIEAERGCWRQ